MLIRLRIEIILFITTEDFGRRVQTKGLSFEPTIRQILSPFVVELKRFAVKPKVLNLEHEIIWMLTLYIVAF